jgi:hypothetical protein
MKRNLGPAIAGLCLLLAALPCLLSGCGNDDEEKSVVPPSDLPLDLESHPLRIATVGTYWSEPIDPSGGTQPYSYYIPASQMPPGIAMDGDPDNVWLRGTPTEAGVYTFTLTVTDHDDDVVAADFTLHVVDAIDLNGTWRYTMTVTKVEGNCGETVGASREHILTITQTGNDVVFAGFFGEPTSQLSGQLSGVVWDLEVSGSYPEEPGLLEATHRLYIYSPDYMDGTEYWDWTGPTSSCTDSQARVTAERISR